MIIEPQPGPQTAFLSCSADIAIYGGAAGGGKTWSLLLDPLRFLGKVKRFYAVIFRRTSPDITNPGALWDESTGIYPHAGGEPTRGLLRWQWADGSYIKFNHMQYEQDMFNWQGAQVPFIGWDELTHFTRRQFFYLLSRNRSTCGVKCYVRATCNPDPDSWVRELISWWLDDDGNAIPERSGVIRYMAMNGSQLEWADDAETLELLGLKPKSFTFIAANVHDNRKLLDVDPGYLANLEALLPHERAQLLGGNWNARLMPGVYFPRRLVQMHIVDAAPEGGDECVYWDRAATVPSVSNPNPDWTAGVRVRRVDGIFYVLRVVRARVDSHAVSNMIKGEADSDRNVMTCLEQDPGQAGVADVDNLTRMLAGYPVVSIPVTRAKEVRARPASSQWHAGNVRLVRGPWNEEFLKELEGFPPKKGGGGKDDQVDGFSGAVNWLADSRNPSIRSIDTPSPRIRTFQ